jgi:type IV pilus assembly protein PilF
LGNLSIAASYGDMLLKIYPDSAASKRYKEELLAHTSAALPVARKSIKLEVPKQQAQIQPALAPQDETVSAVVPALQNETVSAVVPAPQDETMSAVVTATQGETMSAVVPVPQDETVSAVVPNTAEEGEAAENQTTSTTETLAVFHEVKAGENLYRISLQYNIKMERLIEWNGLNNASDIYAGKKLRLVSPDSSSLKE